MTINPHAHIYSFHTSFLSKTIINTAPTPPNNGVQWLPQWKSHGCPHFLPWRKQHQMVLTDSCLHLCGVGWKSHGCPHSLPWRKQHQMVLTDSCLHLCGVGHQGGQHWTTAAAMADLCIRCLSFLVFTTQPCWTWMACCLIFPCLGAKDGTLFWPWYFMTVTTVVHHVSRGWLYGTWMNFYNLVFQMVLLWSIPKMIINYKMQLLFSE